MEAQVYSFELLVFSNSILLTYSRFISNPEISKHIINTIRQVIPNKPIELKKYKEFISITKNVGNNVRKISGTCIINEDNTFQIFLDGEKVNI